MHNRTSPYSQGCRTKHRFTRSARFTVRKPVQSGQFRFKFHDINHVCISYNWNARTPIHCFKVNAAIIVYWFCFVNSVGTRTDSTDTTLALADWIHSCYLVANPPTTAFVLVLVNYALAVHSKIIQQNKLFEHNYVLRQIHLMFIIIVK